MLRWQIDNAKRRVAELEASFKDCGELYSLPKQTDGLPESWAFGNLTSHQVSLSHAQKGLNFVKGQLELTETDLLNGDLPSSIYRIINIYDSIASVNASWTAAAAVRTYRYVGKIRKSKSVAAQNDRTSKPSKESVAEFKNEWLISNGKERGWLTACAIEFSIDAKTVKVILSS